MTLKSDILHKPRPNGLEQLDEKKLLSKEEREDLLNALLETDSEENLPENSQPKLKSVITDPQTARTDSNNPA